MARPKSARVDFAANKAKERDRRAAKSQRAQAKFIAGRRGGPGKLKPSKGRGAAGKGGRKAGGGGGG